MHLKIVTIGLETSAIVYAGFKFGHRPKTAIAFLEVRGTPLRRSFLEL
jgi:hypothetical protein